MFGVDMSPSSQEKGQYGNLTSASGFATGLGENDLTSSSNFMQAILSGDSSKISQALAPQISSAKTSAQNQNLSNAQFGTRSGGTAASTAATNDKVHSDVTNLIGSLTGSAASNLESMGGSLLGQGISGDNAAFGEAQTMQQQQAAQLNDIFSSVAGVASGIAGIPGIGGLFGGSKSSGSAGSDLGAYI